VKKQQRKQKKNTNQTKKTTHRASTQTRTTKHKPRKLSFPLKTGPMLTGQMKAETRGNKQTRKRTHPNRPHPKQPKNQPHKKEKRDTSQTKRGSNRTQNQKTTSPSLHFSDCQQTYSFCVLLPLCQLGSALLDRQ